MSYAVDDLFERESFLGDPNDLDNLVESREREDNSDAEGQDGDAGKYMCTLCYFSVLCYFFFQTALIF